MSTSPSSTWIVLLLLVVNALVALAYLLWRLLAGDGVRAWMNTAIMLICPVVGPIFFVGSLLVYRVFLEKKQIDLAQVSFSHEKKRFVFAPDEDERELVPIEESLLVATHADRRKAFLKSIRLNVDKNVTLYSLALENDDPETSHYSASIVMESAANFQAALQTFAADFDKRPDDVELTLDYAEAVRAYLLSSIPTGIELIRYQRLYAFLLGELRRKHPEELNAENYAFAVSLLLRMQEFPQAEDWAKAAVAQFPDEEASHLSLIKVYYQMGHTDAFMHAMDALSASYIELSRSGAALLRFFAGENTTDGQN